MMQIQERHKCELEECFLDVELKEKKAATIKRTIMNQLFQKKCSPERRKSGAAETDNRKHGVTPGKREKFSWQYAFSCLLECGFCGGNLSRRRWHSNSKYKKTIWQCVKATKEGKCFCLDSKEIPEQVIEKAFVEAYRMLCRDNKDVLEEFDRGIFESIIEKIIVGGYDENGEKDPYKITFIYKTGFTNGIGNAKKRFGKSAGVGEKNVFRCQ